MISSVLNITSSSRSPSPTIESTSLPLQSLHAADRTFFLAFSFLVPPLLSPQQPVPPLLQLSSPPSSLPITSLNHQITSFLSSTQFIAGACQSFSWKYLASDLLDPGKLSDLDLR